eukprot:15169897-Alexandrium_andersonii.AAC.1
MAGRGSEWQATLPHVSGLEALQLPHREAALGLQRFCTHTRATEKPDDPSRALGTNPEASPGAWQFKRPNA